MTRFFGSEGLLCKRGDRVIRSRSTFRTRILFSLTPPSLGIQTFIRCGQFQSRGVKGRTGPGLVPYRDYRRLDWEGRIRTETVQL